MLNFLITLQSIVAERFDRKDDEGATAVEYGLMVALIAVAIVAAVFALGGRLSDLFDEVTAAIS